MFYDYCELNYDFFQGPHLSEDLSLIPFLCLDMFLFSHFLLALSLFALPQVTLAQKTVCSPRR